VGCSKGLGNWYSLESQVRLGKVFSMQVEQSAKVVSDPVVSEYINRIAQNLVRNSDAKVPFTVKVLDDDSVNAFALPGGFFYVQSGLILAADSEAELAGVMAHEIAHVAACHAARQQTRGNLAQLASIPLIFMGGGIGYGLYQAAGIGVPHLVVEGIAGGVATVARARLVAGREGDLGGMADEITEWVLGYPGKSANRLAQLDEQTVWRNTMLEPLVRTGSPEGEIWASKGDRALILSAVAKLAIEGGYGQLTRTRIRSSAKVSGKVFDSYFDSVEACYVAAVEQKLAECLTQVARAQTAGRTWAGGLYRGIVALCEHIADDPTLTSVMLVDDCTTGSIGSLARGRLLESVAEQFGDSAPVKVQPTELVSEISNGAIWTLFHHHMIRDSALRTNLAATLSFISLAPIIGADLTVASIRREQNA